MEKNSNRFSSCKIDPNTPYFTVKCRFSKAATFLSMHMYYDNCYANDYFMSDHKRHFCSDLSAKLFIFVKKSPF